jgi:DNA-binding MarR family transcriptional regulator
LVLTHEDMPAVDVWTCLLRGHAAARRALSSVLQPLGLTVNDYEALLLLSQAEGNLLRRVDLAEGLQLTASGVTRLLDGLEEAGLVEKATCASDARVTYAKLTGAGRERLQQASCSHVASVRALFEERFSEDELRTLADLLGRLPGTGVTRREEYAA